MTNPSEFSIESMDASTLLKSIPFLALEVKHDSLFEDSKELILQVFLDWAAEDLAMKQCKDGITNKLIQCTNKRKDITVLIRAYGKNTEVIIDRNQELA
ncbi:hypothetical protein LPJ73_002940, partial [Coemansia sp. RSA 2703]